MVDYEQHLFSKGEIIPVVIHPCFNLSQESTLYSVQKKGYYIISTSYTEFLRVMFIWSYFGVCFDFGKSCNAIIKEKQTSFIGTADYTD